MKRWYTFFFIALFFLIPSLLATGETPLVDAIAGAAAKLRGEPIWSCLLDERLPRLIVLLLTGASLSTAGAVTQSLFRNPLASPSVLGIPFGGSFVVVIAFVFGLHFRYPAAIPIAAAFGSLGTLLLVYSFSLRKGRLELPSLVLNGIAISTVLMATQKAMLYMMRDQWALIQTLTEWEAGSTADRSWQHVSMQLPFALIGLIGSLRYTRELNVLALGEEEAESLGVDVQKVRTFLFLFVALLIGGALAAVGVIAFFGLILPHILRKLVGSDNRHLLPLSALGGATSLVGLELLLRLTGTYLFTIGNISSLLGGFFFLLLLLGKKESRFSTEEKLC